MAGIIKKFILPSFLILFVGLVFTSNAHAATLSNASDTLSTSRPSAAAPLATNQAVNDSQATVIDLPTTGYNSALWLASDSAVLQADSGQTLSTVTVASMSAANTPSTNQRIVFFTNTVANAHHAGTALITPITAVHIFKFTATDPIPSAGKIILTFPTVANNTASPSASGFSFNNLSNTNVTCYPASACGSSITISGNQITLVNSAGQTSGTTIYVAVGCTTINASGACTAPVPTLINPIKTVQAAGSADSWTVGIQTTNSSGSLIDNASVIAATIEAVQVQGTVQPYITFTISGVNTGQTISTVNAACTGNSDQTNTGINSSATFVNMGSIGSAFNLAAQNLAVSTNGNGYTLSATSSGNFINPSSGYFFPAANGGVLTGIDTPSPQAVTAGTTSFGIHACGSDVYTSSGSWGTGTTGGGNDYTNPFNTGANGYYQNIATYNGTPPGTRTTTVEYEATAATNVPAGTYSTVFTYVATPVF